MDETLNSVNAEQAEAVDSQITSEESEVVTGESESAAPAEQPTTEEKPEEQPKAEPKKQTPEENAAYKALRLEEKQRAEQTARDAVYANLAKQNDWKTIDGRPITTEAEYNAAVSDHAQLTSLMNQGKTEAEARADLRAEQAERRLAEIELNAKKTAQQQQDQQEFFTYFKELNGRDWSPETDPIPDAVWSVNVSGVPLKYAYADYFAKQQMQKTKSIETGKKTAEINAANAATAAGSITGGTAATGEITQTDIDAHANDTAWMMKNYNKVMEVLHKKKG